MYVRSAFNITFNNFTNNLKDYSNYACTIFAYSLVGATVTFVEKG